MIVYCTTNIINGKKYIGKDSRGDKYYLGSGILLNKAIKKYGRENFKKEILAETNCMIMLGELEEYYIDYFNAVKSDLFYNITKGGTGGDTHTNNPNLDAIKQKKSLYWTGRKRQPMSDETKAKIAAKHLGKKRGPRPQWIIDKLIAANTGRKCTVEQRENMRQGQLNKKKGYRHSEETKRKIGLANSKKHE